MDVARRSSLIASDKIIRLDCLHLLDGLTWNKDLWRNWCLSKCSFLLLLLLLSWNDSGLHTQTLNELFPFNYIHLCWKKIILERFLPTLCRRIYWDLVSSWIFFPMMANYIDRFSMIKKSNFFIRSPWKSSIVILFFLRDGRRRDKFSFFTRSANLWDLWKFLSQLQAQKLCECRWIWCVMWQSCSFHILQWDFFTA